MRDYGPDFRECFVCGDREDGPTGGPVAGREPPTRRRSRFPESSPELVWAAIDCPGAYAVGDEGRGTIVLGRMTARVERVPAAGEPCVAASGRSARTAASSTPAPRSSTGEGEVLALPRQAWIVPSA